MTELERLRDRIGLNVDPLLTECEELRQVPPTLGPAGQLDLFGLPPLTIKRYGYHPLTDGVQIFPAHQLRLPLVTITTRLCARMAMRRNMALRVGEQYGFDFIQ